MLEAAKVANFLKAHPEQSISLPDSTRKGLLSYNQNYRDSIHPYFKANVEGFELVYLREMVDSLEEEVFALRKENKALTEEKKELEGHLSELELSNSSIQRDFSTLLSAFRSLEEKNRGLEARIVTLHNENLDSQGALEKRSQGSGQPPHDL